MIIGICEVDFRIHGSMSLKDKRQVMRSLINHIKKKYNVSIAEVGYQDKWQRGQLGIVATSGDTLFLEKMLNQIQTYIETDSRIEVLDYVMDIDKVRWE